MSSGESGCHNLATLIYVTCARPCKDSKKDDEKNMFIMKLPNPLISIAQLFHLAYDHLFYHGSVLSTCTSSLQTPMMYIYLTTF